MQKMTFWKMSGAGNDFVLIRNENYSGRVLEQLAVNLCRIKLSVGADGLLAVKPETDGVISVRYFNSDGSEAFCGNGSRCSALWAFSEKLCGRKTTLKTYSGELEAEIKGENSVRMRMPDVNGIVFGFRGVWPQTVKTLHFLNTGVPHAVAVVDGLDGLDVCTDGRSVRNNAVFGPDGTNVDFVCVDGDTVKIRTYERGVEAETLACGTGITASAVALGIAGGIKSPVRVITGRGDEFKVWFDKNGAGASGVYVMGPAETVFKGEINV